MSGFYKFGTASILLFTFNCLLQVFYLLGESIIYRELKQFFC